MIPYMVGKFAPSSSHLTRGLVKYVPAGGTGPAVVLKAVRLMGAAFSTFHHGPSNLHLSFPTPTIGMKWARSSISRIMYTVHTGTMDMDRE